VSLLLAASFDGLQPVLAACHFNFFSTLANKLHLLLLLVLLLLKVFQEIS